MHLSFVEDGLVLAVFCSCVLSAQLGWEEKEVKWVQVNFTFENAKGQDEVSSEAPACQ